MQKIRIAVCGLVIVLFAMVACFGISGCGKVDDNGVQMSYYAGGTLLTNSDGSQEWVSPDGVHYWYMNHYYREAIALRVLPDGSLVVDSAPDTH